MIFLISLIPYFILILLDYKKGLHMAQQNLYNDDNRFLKWTLNDIKKFKVDLKCKLIVLITYLIIILFNFETSYLTNIYFFIICVFLILNHINENKSKNIKLKFKVTSRVKRLIVTNVLLIVLISFLEYKIGDNNINYFILILFDLFINYVITLSIIINKPAEKIVYLSYKTKALKKLKQMNNLDVIGITGSYGKTSSKNILNDILSIKYNVLPSPKNFNTPYGLIITINNYLDKFDDILIAEMGAYKKGEINQLCDLVKPKYGILTKIGTAHIEIFGSQKNIQEGKFELIENLPLDGCAVLNGDDPLQRSYNLKNNCKVLWIGIESSDVDVRATNIKISADGTTFDCIFKDENKKYTFTTKLLGYNNIYNILASLALAKELNLNINQMKKAVASVKAVEHRLELRNAGNITYIDDSYNSNPEGSKMALDTLSHMKGLKVIMTPGMIELGNKAYELNKEFGFYMKDKTDIVILVGEKITKPIMDGLKESNFDSKNIHIVKDTKEGFDLIKKLCKNKESCVLIENDLPDIYDE